MSVSVASEAPNVSVSGESVNVVIGAVQGPAGPPPTDTFMIGLNRDVVVSGTQTPFSYVGLDFTLTDLKQSSCTGGSFTMAIRKNGTTVFTTTVNSTPADATINVAFAVGDSLDIVTSGVSGTPTVQKGTLLGTKG